MEVVSHATPEGELDAVTEESDLGSGDLQQPQPRRSLEMIREEQEDEVKVQHANVVQQ